MQVFCNKGHQRGGAGAGQGKAQMNAPRRRPEDHRHHEHAGQRTNDLRHHIPQRIRCGDLALPPERQRDRRIEMAAAALTERRQHDRGGAAGEHQAGQQTPQRAGRNHVGHRAPVGKHDGHGTDADQHHDRGAEQFRGILRQMGFHAATGVRSMSLSTAGSRLP